MVVSILPYDRPTGIMGILYTFVVVALFFRSFLSLLL